MITGKEIRQRFLQYFENNGHKVVKSSGLVPKDDPSLLFTNAGMVQFKKAFLGLEKREYNRAASSQKCLRVGGKHNDLENVGRTARHHTFFEMLGNFSFGDYFKEDAIRYAWEFLTEDLKLAKDKLYATVYTDDDEAFELWEKLASLPKERIYRLGEKDNFWSMGDTGPCGPCSEILYDQGEEMACGPDCEIGVCECDRYLEIWNLVFMQFDRDQNGKLTPLPKPSIDTGMGLERIAAVCQGVHSNFETDLFTELFHSLEQLSNVKFGRDEERNTAFRVIADHSRAVSFMITDGILPSNEGRGYVLRRLIRRAYRFGRLINLEKPFLHKICLSVVDQMKDTFPELLENAKFMSRVVAQEEERFSQTLDKGLQILSEELKQLEQKKQKTVAGKVAFQLYDTYGFPLDIVNDIAEKHGYSVDEEGFNRLMEKQKKQSKEAWSGSGETDLSAKFFNLLEEGKESRFIGYGTLKGTGRVIALMNVKGESVSRLAQKEKGYLVTDQTPFYGESGGQVGDRGRIKTTSGMMEVVDTIKPSEKLIIHQVEGRKGTVSLDQDAELIVDEGIRVATARNHTCTHLLHAALRKVLGEHVKQSGSLVSSSRLRFDFTHITQLTPEELQKVEEDVNRAILAGLPVQTELMEYDDAVEKGAMALFGEKYEEQVRVVEVPGESVELCGGTHLDNTSMAGSFYLLSESGVAAGVRRIEALTGWDALNLWREKRALVQNISSLLKAKPQDVAKRVKEITEEIKSLQKEKKSLEDKLVSSSGTDFLGEVEMVEGVKLLCSKPDVKDMRGLRNLMDDLRSKIDSGVVCLATSNGEKSNMILHVSKDLHHRFTAPELIKKIAGEIGGSGGGRPDLAQAGGNNPQGVDRAFDKLKKIVAEA